MFKLCFCYISLTLTFEVRMIANFIFVNSNLAHSCEFDPQKFVHWTNSPPQKRCVTAWIFNYSNLSQRCLFLCRIMLLTLMSQITPRPSPAWLAAAPMICLQKITQHWKGVSFGSWDRDRDEEFLKCYWNLERMRESLMHRSEESLCPMPMSLLWRFCWLNWRKVVTMKDSRRWLIAWV